MRIVATILPLALLFGACHAGQLLSLREATSDASALRLVESKAEDQDTVFNGMHVGMAMEHGWWRTAKKLVQVCRQRGIDVSHVVHQKADAVRRHLKEVVDAISTPTIKAVARRIVPALQWAQSGDAVFLNVKFAHRFDAPATLGCHGDNVTLTNTSLALFSECRGGKAFHLHLRFLRAIDPNNSTWSLASVGRMTFTIAKVRGATIWPRLLRSRKKPANLHVWWAMKDQYEAELRNITKAAEAAANATANATGTAAPAGSATVPVTNGAAGGDSATTASSSSSSSSSSSGDASGSSARGSGAAGNGGGADGDDGEGDDDEDEDEHEQGEEGSGGARAEGREEDGARAGEDQEADAEAGEEDGEEDDRDDKAAAGAGATVRPPGMPAAKEEL